MGCGDVCLLRTIGGVDVTGQERAALNKLTMPASASQKNRRLLRLAQAGDPRPHLGRDRRGRRRHPALAGPLEDAGGADSPDLTTHRRGPGAAAGTPRPRQPARLPPRRHPRPALAHGVAHRLPGGRRTDPLPPRLSPHRRPQPDPRERPRAGRHAPDRAQEPRHFRPLQHHPQSIMVQSIPMVSHTVQIKYFS